MYIYIYVYTYISSLIVDSRPVGSAVSRCVGRFRKTLQSYDLTDNMLCFFLQIKQITLTAAAARSFFSLFATAAARSFSSLLAAAATVASAADAASSFFLVVSAVAWSVCVSHVSKCVSMCICNPCACTSVPSCVRVWACICRRACMCGRVYVGVRAGACVRGLVYV